MHASKARAVLTTVTLISALLYGFCATAAETTRQERWNMVTYSAFIGPDHKATHKSYSVNQYPSEADCLLMKSVNDLAAGYGNNPESRFIEIRICQPASMPVRSNK